MYLIKVLFYYWYVFFADRLELFRKILLGFHKDVFCMYILFLHIADNTEYFFIIFSKKIFLPSHNPDSRPGWQSKLPFPQKTLRPK